MGQLLDPILTEVFLEIVEEHAVVLVAEDIERRAIRAATQAIVNY
jgi:hypothetical protein